MILSKKYYQKRGVWKKDLKTYCQKRGGGGGGLKKDKKGKIVIYGELPLEGGVQIFYTLWLYVYIVFLYLNLLH